jgi:hypothetical protein
MLRIIDLSTLIRVLLLAVMMVTGTLKTLAQKNVGIGTLNPAEDALLDLSANDKGLLVPRLTSSQRLALNPQSDGLFVYDIDVHKFYYWKADESRWQILDDNSALNELIHHVAYDTASNILRIQDAGGIYEVDLTKLDNRKGYQKIYLSPTGGTVTLTNDGQSVRLPDSSATNEIQFIERSNDTIYLSQGGFVVLPFDKVFDGDSSTTNELQLIAKDSNIIRLSLGGGSIRLNDDDSLNELQNLSYLTLDSNNRLSIAIDRGNVVSTD